MKKQGSASLEMIEFQVADVSHSTFALMHCKDLITEKLMIIGSYKNSHAACYFNWDTIVIVERCEDDIFCFNAA